MLNDTHRDTQQKAVCEGSWACKLVFSTSKLQGKKEMEGKAVYLKRVKRTSLVIQWLRIPLPMQGNGFDPWSGKIPRATEQLSPCTPTTEPGLSSLGAATTDADLP